MNRASKLAAFLLLVPALVTACGGNDGGGSTDAGPTGDVTAPTVVATTPADGATDVALDATVSVTFSEAIDCATMDERAFLIAAGGQLTGAITCQGATAVFTPDAPLAVDTTYGAQITTGLKDVAGNALEAPYAWSFTTRPDQVAPTVVSTDPADGATGVALDAAVSITFDEALDPDTVAAGAFTLSDGTTAVPGALAYDDATFTVTFTPDADFAFDTTYTATVTSALTDAAGNALGASHTWSFTTAADTAAPAIVALSPEDGATDVSLNATVSATFDEAIDCAGATLEVQDAAGAVAGTLACADAGITFTPDAELTPFSEYTAQVTAADAYGNETSGSWSFTTGNTGDTVAPEVIATSPAADATDVLIDTIVTVTFSEDIDPASLTAASFNLYSVSASSTVAGATTYDAATHTATFTPDADLAPMAQYTIRVTAAVKDRAGNGLAGPGLTFSFTTGNEPIPPQVSSVTPADGAHGVLLPTVTVTFDESMDGATIDTTTFTVFDGASFLPGTVSYDDATHTATFHGNAPFDAAALEATVSGTVTDAAGNAMGADYTWSFSSRWPPESVPGTNTPALALDAQGHAYVGCAGRFSSNASGTWAETVVSQTPGRTCTTHSLAVDAQGRVHMLNMLSGALSYDRWQNGTLQITEEIDSVGLSSYPYDNLERPSLALASDGTPRAAWIVNLQDFTSDAFPYYGVRDSGGWTIGSVLGSLSGSDSGRMAFALAADDTPYVAYNLMAFDYSLSVGPAGSWSRSTITPNGGPIDMAVTNGTVRILQASSGELILNERAGSTWQATTLNDPGETLTGLAMKVENGGTVHILVRADSDLYYLTNAYASLTGGWDRFLVAHLTLPATTQGSLVLGANHRPHFAWSDGGQLYYAH